MDKGEIILYQSDDRSTQLEVRMDEEIVYSISANIVKKITILAQNR